MRIQKGEMPFHVVNTSLLILLALTCVIPFIHVLALSFSSGLAADKGIVGLWPVYPTVAAYQYTFQDTGFIRAFGITVLRVILGVTIAMILNVLTAYPLSKTARQFPGRSLLSWFFVVTMLVNGGLIPTYLIVSATRLRNTIWALVVPGAVWAFNVMLLLNFFRQLPKELEESAYLDGAGPWRILFQIYIPLSTAVLATLVIWTTVGHWNEWFAGLIYMDSIRNYPLQTYLQGIIVEPRFDLLDISQIELLSRLSRRTFNAAQIIIATVPVITVYPFLQRYFVKGMQLGGLKG
ncbi:MAG TPA: carbohydrate ABC transporter permease [Spirochaetia bacterium]|nr:carbohydrate ABC transporter permease [Spirochaetia bacterium]